MILYLKSTYKVETSQLVSFDNFWCLHFCKWKNNCFFITIGIFRAEQFRLDRADTLTYDE